MYVNGFILLLAVFAYVWIIDGYFMWKRRACILRDHVQANDLEGAKKAVSYWADKA